MSYYIGIDGGGSKTKCILCNDKLEKIFQKESNPSNFLTIGIDQVTRTILDLIKSSLQDSDISLKDIKGIVLGTTGAGRKSNADLLQNAVINLAAEEGLTLNSFTVVSDALIALEGAFSGNPGSILIAGTGSIMFGKDSKGNIHRVGGFGRLIGDEGSGLSIGRKGLNILSKYIDGRGKYSSIVDKVKKEFNITTQDELITKVYTDNFEIQKIAPLVIESAQEGDIICNEILDAESNELLLHIMAMQKKLNEKNLKVVFVGGTIVNENAYSKMLLKKIKDFLQNVSVTQPDYPPEIGAVLLAKKK